MEITEGQLRYLRVRANGLRVGLSDASVNPLENVQAVLALQAQELPSARLSLRARSQGLTASALERMRLDERSLVWTWCLRGTLHLLASEDLRWLLPLLSPGLIQSHRSRFQQLGWDEENSRLGLGVIEKALQERPYLERSEIASMLAARKLPFEGQSTVHLLYRAALEGLLCAGPLVNGKTAYVLLPDWAGNLQPLPEEEALSRLARRYLSAYAPASPADLASWSGLKLAQARHALELVSSQLVEVRCAGQVYWLPQARAGWLEEFGFRDLNVHLLPRYDTFLLGYASRTFCVPSEFTSRVNAGGGVIHATLLVNGQVQGTWKLQSKGRSQILQLQPFAPLSQAVLQSVESELIDLRRFQELEGEIKLEVAG